ncbi:MAG: hypothetical protein ABSD20_04645 [Terriglobales bacterium]
MASTGTRRTRYRRPACPTCAGEDEVVRIVYGDPSPEIIEQSQRGEIALGGCSTGLSEDDWYCRACHRCFSDPGFAAAADA